MMHKPLAKYLLLLGMLPALSACALGPDFMRPETAAKSAPYINAPKENTPSQKMSQWWTQIDDPLLDQYITTLRAQNLQLSQAAERLIQARAAVTAETGAYYPTLSASANAGRSFAPATIGTGRSYVNSYNPELSSTWEIDLFGRIRRSVEAADATYIASIYDREALLHSLIADLVSLRVEIAVNKRLLDLAKKNVKNREEIYGYIKNQYELGVAGSAPQNVFQAEDNLTSAQSDVHTYERLLADAIYRFDVLLGQTPGTTNPLETEFPIIVPALDVPLCLPADLLDRRPDLRASELRIKAANADIGVAIADLFPTLSLSGSIGFTSDSTNGLFNANQLAGSILGSITARLFQGGALRANIEIQESQARELTAAYAEDVLNALREVESGLKADRELVQELHNDKRSVEALRQAERIMYDRYRQGVESFQDYLNTQRNLYIAEQTLLSTQSTHWNARISLYLALGGDWVPENNMTTLSSCTKDNIDDPE